MSEIAYFPGKPELPAHLQPGYLPDFPDPAPLRDNYFSRVRSAASAFSRAGFALCAMLLSTSLMATVLSLAAQLTVPSLSGDMMMLISSVASYGVGAPVFFLILRGMVVKRPVKAPLSFGMFLAFLMMCFGLLYPLSLLGVGFNQLLTSFLGIQPSDILTDVVDSMSLVGIFLSTVIAAPIMEELLFRQLLLDRLSGFGMLPAIAFSGLCFGLYHGNFYQFFYAFALGCFFAYVYLRSGKIRYTIGLHMAVNFVGSFLPTLLQRYFEENSFPVLLESAVVGMCVNAGIVLWIVLGACRKLKLPHQDAHLPTGKEARCFLNVGSILFFCLISMEFLVNLFS